ncbi:jg14253 [Pararge aegeria aegeria]|uniref:Jg14253 protein n=1 Tax=Pararge aegeria aegeria TaxID=348720 RepID=A0A8S4RHD5_9NEOP|nr:jg14253 [Pararge aegeria aegeria]
MRRKKENWAKDITEWYPRDGRRRRERSLRRWEDHLGTTAEPLWTRKSHDRETWKNLGEAYAKSRQSSETVSGAGSGLLPNSACCKTQQLRSVLLSHFAPQPRSAPVHGGQTQNATPLRIRPFLDFAACSNPVDWQP